MMGVHFTVLVNNPGYDSPGVVEDEITLVIDFTGNDCDGIHTDGIVKLTRIK